MQTDSEILEALLEELKQAIYDNQNPDGSFAFDTLRAKAAIQFAVNEIQKTAGERNPTE